MRRLALNEEETDGVEDAGGQWRSAARERPVMHSLVASLAS